MSLLRFLHAVITNSPLGSVSATTSKAYFVEGELVQGTVHCDFIAPVAAKSITVVLEGYEKVEWHQRDDESRQVPGSDPPQYNTIPRYVRRRAKKRFFKQKIPVRTRTRTAQRSTAGHGTARHGTGRQQQRSGARHSHGRDPCCVL